MLPFKKTEKQQVAIRLLASNAKHILLRGGSRSGKTFIIIYAILVRAAKVKSRHVCLRKHFSHIKQAIWLDTLPKVLDICFPELKAAIKWDRSDWYITLPNGSEVWLGGLDDKERTEKILGKEFSTMYFNECSEIDLDSRNIALTRLAEKNALKKKAYYDANPPKKTHWTYTHFIENKDQDGMPIEGYATMKLNPKDNEDNIDPDYIAEILERLPPMLRMRFLDGDFGSDSSDIFKMEWILPCEPPNPKEIAAVFAFCDPAVTTKELATENSCESAIVVLGITYSNKIIDLEVLHGMWEYQQLKAHCVDIHARYKGYGSFFIGSEDVAAQQWLISDLQAQHVPCVGLKPDSDKVRRAISVTDLLADGRCHVNSDDLRNQLMGFPGGKLKDLVDAYVYALRLIKKYSQKVYKNPHIEDSFVPLSPSERVKIWQEKRRKQIAQRSRSGGNDAYLGKKW